jgi:hypothetical protein
VTWLVAVFTSVLVLLIAFCVFAAVLHPDPEKAARALKVLQMLRSIPFIRQYGRSPGWAWLGLGRVSNVLVTALSWRNIGSGGA